MEKIIFIAPHLSTGGLPQYLLKKIQLLKNEYEIYCVEFDDITGGNLIIQKSKIQEILDKKHFITLGNNKGYLNILINSIKPDYIHIEEIVEHFISPSYKDVADKIFSPTRKYKIFETSHDSSFDPDIMVKYLPDAFLFVSQWQMDRYKNIDIPKYLVEYPIEYHDRPDRNSCLKQLGLSTEKKHVLNIGLFTPRKNQSEAFDIASRMPDIEFHFIGNMADNFVEYWQPLMDNKPANCRIWGERNDVDLFLGCMDLFLFTSRGYDGDKETMPLVLKEAIGWNMPIFMYDLDVYLGYFNKFNHINHLTGDIDSDVENIYKSVTSSAIVIQRDEKGSRSVSFDWPYEFPSGLTPTMLSNSGSGIMIPSGDIGISYDGNGKFTMKIRVTNEELRDMGIIISLVDSYNGLTNYVFNATYADDDLWFSTNGGENNFNGFRIDIHDKNGNKIYSKIVINFNRLPKLIPTVNGEEIMMRHNKLDHSAWWSYYEVFVKKEYDGVHDGDVVVDIGANIGLFSLFALNEGASKVYCIEPSDISDLSSNLSKFTDKVTIINKAINKEDSDVSFYAGNVSSTHTLFAYESGIDWNKNVIIPGVRISSIIADNDIKKIDFLKIDCEGAEYFLFDDIDEEYLKNNIDRICCEIHGFAGSQHDYETKIRSKLIRCGFDVIETGNLNLDPHFIMWATRKPKIKIAHILIDVEAEREAKSIKSLTEFSEASGMKYEQHLNQVYVGIPPSENCGRPGDISMSPGHYKLGPGHYGCYLAHKNAVLSAFLNDDCDAVLLNECDSILQYSHKEFAEKVYEAYKYCNKYDLAYVSFGKKIIGQHHDNVNDDFFITTRLSEAHCILIPRSKYEYFKHVYETSPWDVADMWYNKHIKGNKGIFSRPYSLQYAGISHIDQKFKDGHIIEEKNSTLSTTDMDDISVIIQTCDKYDFLWQGWYLSWSRNWCWSLGWPVYFCNEGKALPFNDRRITHISSPASSDANGFSTRLRDILNRVNTKYVLYIQDDMWLTGKISINKMANALYAMKHFGWDSLKIHERIWFNYTLTKTHHFIDDMRVLKYTNDSEYLFTHNAAIWKRDFLIEVLEDNENPWDNEFNGTKRIAYKGNAEIYHLDYGWYWQPGVCNNGVLTETGQELLRQLIAREDYRLKFDL